MASSFGPKGQPYVSSGDAPSLAAQLKEVADYAAQMGGRRVGTTAERDAFTTAGHAYVGFVWGNTTKGFDEEYTPGGWQSRTDVELTTSSFFTPGTGFTMLSISKVYLRGKIVWGTIVMTGSTDFSSNQWFGNVASGYLPVTEVTSVDIHTLLSIGGNATPGFAQLVRADRAIRGFTVSTGNRRVSFSFQWATN